MPSSEMVERRDSIQAIPDGPAKKDALDKFQKEAGKGGAPRLFVGKGRDKAIVVNVRDKQGQSRFRLQVDSLGAPRMEFFDEKGNITYSLPDSARPRAFK